MKIGDQVVIMSRSGEVCGITTLSEQNKRYWIIGDLHFHKTSGRIVEGWNISHIELAEEKHFVALRKKELLEKMDSVKWSNYNLETLVTVHSIINSQESDILLELLQISEQMMFREKCNNPLLELTHKMLQGVLRNYHDFSQVN